MIRSSWLTITPYRGRDSCDHWLSISPARVAGILVGVGIRLGDRAVMVDVPRRVDLALAVQECDCGAEHE